MLQLWAKRTTERQQDLPRGPAAVEKLGKEVPDAAALLSQHLPGEHGTQKKDHNHGTAEQYKQYDAPDAHTIAYGQTDEIALFPKKN